MTWLKPFPTANLTKGMRVVAPTNSPSVRSLDVPYNKANPKNIFGTIDGFLVSKNIKDLSVKTINNDFKSSDHQPVVMQFELQK